MSVGTCRQCKPALRTNQEHSTHGPTSPNRTPARPAYSVRGDGVWRHAQRGHRHGQCGAHAGPDAGRAGAGRGRRGGARGDRGGRRIERCDRLDRRRGRLPVRRRPRGRSAIACGRPPPARARRGCCSCGREWCSTRTWIEETRRFIEHAELGGRVDARAAAFRRAGEADTLGSTIVEGLAADRGRARRAAAPAAGPADLEDRSTRSSAAIAANGADPETTLAPPPRPPPHRHAAQPNHDGGGRGVLDRMPHPLSSRRFMSAPNSAPLASNKKPMKLAALRGSSATFLNSEESPMNPCAADPEPTACLDRGTNRSLPDCATCYSARCSSCRRASGSRMRNR